MKQVRLPLILSTLLLLFIVLISIQKPVIKQPKGSPKMKEPTNGNGYFKFISNKKSGGTGIFPLGAITKAKKHIDNMVTSQRDAGIWDWEWMGPSNIGGRIRCILINPDNPSNIWIGSVSGGIWKTTTEGVNWFPVNDFMANLAVTSIVFDPGSTDTMYASTGEGIFNSDAVRGEGIFKSTDGGLTWNQLPSTNNSNFSWVNRLEPHPNPDSSGVIFAVTSFPGQLFKTTDGGNSWQQLFASGSKFLDINIDSHNNNELIIGSSGGVFLSTDWGHTWEEETDGSAGKMPNDGGRCEVSFCPSNTSRIYVVMDRNGGEIYRSNDNGNTWVLKSSGTSFNSSQAWYNTALWVDPTLSSRIVVGGTDIWRSTNGGENLTKISNWRHYHNGSDATSAHSDQHFIVETPNYNASTNPVVYFSNDGGIQKTNDIWSVSETSGWINLVGNLGITQFYAGAVTPDGSLIIGGSQDNDILRYRKSGSWSGAFNWYQAKTGDGGYCAINPDNSDILYSEYIYLHISKSINGGDNYFQATNGLLDAQIDSTDSLAIFIAPFMMDPNNPSTLIAGGARIWRTTDDAANWDSIKTFITPINCGTKKCFDKCTAIDIAAGNSACIWVGYQGGRVDFTTDNGITWQRVDTNSITLPRRFVSDISINPNNQNEVFVSFTGYKADNVYYTPDAGQTWIQRSGTNPYSLPVLPVNTIIYHPHNGDWLYAGTDLGVFATEDRGQNWSITTPYPNNEGPANVEVDDLFWQNNELLIAATHGRGMYRTKAPTLTVYVDHNNSYHGNGTKDNPFQTIFMATQVYGPGTTISVESGIYDESQILDFTKRGYIINTNGDVIIK